MSQEPKKPIVKRYSLTKNEREKVGNIQSVLGILALQREGLQHSMTLALMGARQRMAIKDSDAPEGYVRSVDFDPQTDEIIVTDMPKPDEPAQEANHVAEPGQATDDKKPN